MVIIDNKRNLNFDLKKDAKLVVCRIKKKDPHTKQKNNQIYKNQKKRGLF
jgi:hypothetical protein